MKDAIKTASINHNEQNNVRVTLYLLPDDKAGYRWWTQHNEDTDVTGKTVADACDNAQDVWAGAAWDLQADWLQGNNSL